MSEATLREQFVFRSGDLNGFIQLFFDNLATLLGLIFVLNTVLRGFDNKDLAANSSPDAQFYEQVKGINEYIDEIIYQRSIPGLAITMVFGNLYYTWMGARLGRDEDRKGDVTALPYGVNTPGAFAFLFSIIGPAAAGYGGANCSALLPLTDEAGAIVYRECWERAADAGWGAGVVSNLLAGIISVALGLIGDQVLRVTPPVALLTSLAGIGFTFLGINQVAQNFSQPLVGLLPLYLTIAAYFGDVGFGKLPKSLVIAVVGVALAWADGTVTGAGVEASLGNVKPWGVSTGFSALSDWSNVGTYIGTTFPVALAAAAGTLMNVISAEGAGDKYGTAETMISDGVGTMIGALFGTPFGTSVYIGHPAYKKMGAGIVYSLINCVFFFLFAVFGIFALVQAIIPPTAVAPLIFFVGVMICQEAMAAAPVRQYPAFIFGLFPSLTDWAVVGGLSLEGIGGSQYFGFVSMSKASLLLALVSSSITIFLIERDYLPAVGWALAAAVLSSFGLLHQESAKLENWLEPQSLYCKYPAISFDEGNTNVVCAANMEPCTVAFGPPLCGPSSTLKWRFMTGYLMIAVTFVLLYVGQRMGWVADKVDDQVHQGEEAETSKSQMAAVVRRMSKDYEESETEKVL